MSSKVATVGFEEIPKEQRQSWISLASIWTGSMICIPSLMVGGLLAVSFSLPEAIIIMIIGYSIVCAYMCLIGMQSCDTGLPTASLAAGALGRKGSQFIISSLLAIACMGWFGVQTAICAIAFSTMLYAMAGIYIPVWISGIIWGFLMLVTAIYGYNALKYLNYISIPALVLVLAYSFWVAMVQNDGIDVLATYVPISPMSYVMGINMVVASFALGGVISGDYSRYAHNRGDVVKSSILGVMPSAIIVVTIGVILSIVAGEFDITAILVSLGLPVVGLVTLIVATWSTNALNAYSGGVAVTNLVGASESKFKLTTGIAGVIGTILGAVGIINMFVGFLSILTALIPPVAGVMIANYWIVGRGKRENFHMPEGLHLPGVISFALGAIVAYTTGSIFLFFIAPINGIVISMVSYILLENAMNKRR